MAAVSASRPAWCTSRRRSRRRAARSPPGTPTLAVGNPSSAPPRPSPGDHAPRTWWGRPSSAAASSTSPSATSGRIRVDDTDLAVAAAGSTPTTSKPEVRARARCSRADVALAAVAEVEVLADHHHRAPERVDEDLGDEVLGGLVGPARSKGTTSVRSIPQPGQQLELLVEVGEQQRRRLGPHHRGRVPVEGDHRTGRAALGGQRAQLAEQRAVPEVHAVVGADGHRRTVAPAGCALLGAGRPPSRATLDRLVGQPRRPTAGRMRSVRSAS